METATSENDSSSSNNLTNTSIPQQIFAILHILEDHFQHHRKCKALLETCHIKEIKEIYIYI
jgi:hypothetical protein